MTPTTTTQQNPRMDECIDNCTNCHALCEATIAHCLQMGGKHAEHQHIALMATCADICATSADAMLRGTEAHTITCGACAEICRKCAESCASMGDDAQMQQCAEMCRKCAESCEAMAA